MIIGDLNKLDKTIGLPIIIKEICNYIKYIDLNEIELGKHIIDEEKNIFMIVAEGTTVPSNTKETELHHDFIDVQILIKGKELIEYDISEPNLNNYNQYDIENDIQFTKEVAFKNQLVLKPMMFAVFFPYEQHKPTCNIGDLSYDFRKIVIKIPHILL